MEFQFLFVTDGSLTAGREPGTGTGGQIWREFQFLFVVEVPEPPFGNRELELEDRFRWNFSSCSWSRFLSRQSGTGNWNWRPDLHGISVPVRHRWYLNGHSGTGNWNWRADLDGISVPVRGRGS